MKKFKLSADKIFRILENVNNGQKVTFVCKKNNIHRQTFYNLKRTFKDLTLVEIKQIIDLKEQIKKLTIDLKKKELEISALKDIIEKKI